MMTRWIRHLSLAIALSGIAIGTTAGCDSTHGHEEHGGHEHGHDEHGHNEHGHNEHGAHENHAEHDGPEPHAAEKTVKDDRYRHADAHPQGHDHHAPGHGHGGAVARITHFSDTLELFAEHAPAVANETLSLLTHLTYLDGFKPITEGPVRLTLTGPETLTAVANRADRPGIFTLSLRPTQPGTYQGSLTVEGPMQGQMTGFSVIVHASQDAAGDATPDHDDEGAIDFLKEQQWKVPFSTLAVSVDRLQSRVQVQGVVDTPPGGSASVAAPIAGRLVPPKAGLPIPGQWVDKGQRLASLSPTPGAPEEAARATLAVAVAEARIGAAQAALSRAKKLQTVDAISARDFEEAKREAQLAQKAAQAAKRADALYTNAARGSSTGSWRINAPISGLLTDVDTEPGATVQANQALFHIIDTRTLWLRARVPEPLAANLSLKMAPAYRVVGQDAWQTLHLTGAEQDAKLIHISPRVDPKTRTVDILYALHKPPAELRVNGMVEVALPTGDSFQGIVIPARAIVNDGGRSLTYVQTDGEHFEERAVKTTTVSGGRVGIEAGLKAGERIVVRGANVVRLSARSTAAPGHGHLH